MKSYDPPSHWCLTEPLYYCVSKSTCHCPYLMWGFPLPVLPKFSSLSIPMCPFLSNCYPHPQKTNKKTPNSSLTCLGAHTLNLFGGSHLFGGSQTLFGGHTCTWYILHCYLKGVSLLISVFTKYVLNDSIFVLFIIPMERFSLEMTAGTWPITSES